MKTFWVFAPLQLAGCQCPAVAGVASCIDSAKDNPRAVCTRGCSPVGGCDGETYANVGAAPRAGVRRTAPGPLAPAQ